MCIISPAFTEMEKQQQRKAMEVFCLLKRGSSLHK